MPRKLNQSEIDIDQKRSYHAALCVHAVLSQTGLDETDTVSGEWGGGGGGGGGGAQCKRLPSAWANGRLRVNTLYALYSLQIT